MQILLIASCALKISTIVCHQVQNEQAFQTTCVFVGRFDKLRKINNILHKFISDTIFSFWTNVWENNTYMCNNVYMLIIKLCSKRSSAQCLLKHIVLTEYFEVKTYDQVATVMKKHIKAWMSSEGNYLLSFAGDLRCSDQQHFKRCIESNSCLNYVVRCV